MSGDEDVGRSHPCEGCRVRIAIITDAWAPQTNGVVTTLAATARELSRIGHDVRILSAEGLRCLPCPSYPEIRLALWPPVSAAARRWPAGCRWPPSRSRGLSMCCGQA
jgi:hypothetical protein